MHILVVDDSEFARNRISSRLRAAGHTVVEADSGAAALETIRTTSFQAATVDLLMPDIDGFHVIREMRALCPKAYIIALSADMQQATQSACLEAGADRFIPKTRIDDVLLYLERLFDRERLLAALSESDKNAFTELVNQAMHHAADALESLMETLVRLHVPEIELMSDVGLSRFFIESLGEVGVIVRQRFSGALNGMSAIVLSTGDAMYLVRALAGMQHELGRLSLADQSVLTEMGNVLLNAAISVLADLCDRRILVSMPDLTMSMSGEQAVRYLLTGISDAETAFVLVSKLTIAQTELISYLIVLLSKSDAHMLIDRIRQKNQAVGP